MSEPIRVQVVDDQRLMREGLRTLLEMEADIEVVGEAENGPIAIERYGELPPDVVLMDVRMPEVDGVEAIRQLCNRWPEAKVIIFTTFDDDEYVFEGLRAGARGYLLKDVSGAELADAIRKVHAGGALIEPSVARKVVAEFARIAPCTPATRRRLIEPLSDREQEVLALVSEGYTNREITARLHLAGGTVKNYVTNILGKINARDRSQAALRARELGLI